MSEVVWTKATVHDLGVIAEYIRQFDEVAAERIVASIVDAAEALASFTELGAQIAGTHFRRWSVRGTSYKLESVVRAEQPVILRVWHARQDWLSRT